MSLNIAHVSPATQEHLKDLYVASIKAAISTLGKVP
jgi:hypothetical protein